MEDTPFASVKLADLFACHLNVKEFPMKLRAFGKAGVLGLLLLAAAGPARAEKYTIDPDHSSITFKIQHLNITWVHGRFNEFSGEFTLDKDDPTKSSFTATIKVDSIDTNQKKRDDHLRTAQFFDVKKYPE